ncbi:hypothetical protein Tsubulata_045865 [Turnera subulata]|uniref:Uncharacterized protein n=1 Tax=Turnera subulata TaxID=218843 RepID=A0A9Q0F800_9ROSI|nr:hypothetical protein Tsubulata_045865 [Turnera subulata]
MSMNLFTICLILTLFFYMYVYRKIRLPIPGTGDFFQCLKKMTFFPGHFKLYMYLARMDFGPRISNQINNLTGIKIYN